MELNLEGKTKFSHEGAGTDECRRKHLEENI